MARLLSRSVWKVGDAENRLTAEVHAISTEIRRHLKLSEIAAKLRDGLREGFTQDEKGLAKAIQLTLEPNERELAEESFAELRKRLLETDVVPIPTSAAELDIQPELDLGEQPDILAAIIEGVSKTVPTRRGNRSSDL